MVIVFVELFGLYVYGVWCGVVVGDVLFDYQLCIGFVELIVFDVVMYFVVCGGVVQVCGIGIGDVVVGWVGMVQWGQDVVFGQDCGIVFGVVGIE